jgi:hypothetical protein
VKDDDSGSQVDGETLWSTDPALNELVRPRLTRRARLLRGGALAALVLAVAVGIVWNVNGHTGSTPPVATTELPVLLVTSSVTYGTLSLNGGANRGAAGRRPPAPWP